MVIEVTPDGRSYYWLIGLLIGLPLGTLLVASLFSKDIDFWPLLTSLGGILSIAPPLVLAIGLFFVLKGSIRVEAESLKIDAMITKKTFSLKAPYKIYDGMPPFLFGSRKTLLSGWLCVLLASACPASERVTFG